MRHKFLFSFLLACLFVLVGCGGDGFPKNPNLVTDEDLRVFVDAIMHQQYYWSAETKTVDPLSYDDAESLLLDLRQADYDRWTYLTTPGEQDAYYSEGQYVGFGYSSRWCDDDSIELLIVQPGSPADRAGLRRGSRLIAIAGIPTSDLRSDAVAYQQALGEQAEGVSVDFTVVYSDGSQRELRMTRAVVTLDPVPTAVVQSLSGGTRVGYLVFHQFISPARAAFTQALKDLRSAGIDELVIDLRYNGGGSLQVAQELLSLLLPPQPVARAGLWPFADMASGLSSRPLLFTLQFNDTGWQGDRHFYRLNLAAEGPVVDRIVFLTGAGTASASETVINSLRPYLDVILIGDTTHGKPVGMNSFSHPPSGKLLVPITFRVINAAGEGDYFDGFAPDAVATDSTAWALGDTDEPLLQTALQYFLTGQLQGTATASSTRVRELNPQEAYSGFNGAINWL
jgi:carboxyl-terminal processing protease